MTDTAFADLLARATTDPGTLSAAYFAFHGYSLGNMMLAAGQCAARDIPLGPIASFNRWKELGRHVLKGQKAIELCMPVTGKKEDAESGETTHYTRFIFRRNWFVPRQTEGQDYTPPAPPAWDQARALTALDITAEPFEHLDGNTQGYARARTVAINPIAAHPFKTLFHELAHILLGHTAETPDQRTARDTREVEAESVAMLCCAALGLPSLDDSRGYIQHWNTNNAPIDEPTARRIIKTADQILKAGSPQEEAE